MDKKIGFIRQESIDKTHLFFEKYGGFTIVIARFVPFVRSFAPFFAGLAQMNFYHFFLYNLLGAVLWILSFTLAGYFFGNLPSCSGKFQPRNNPDHRALAYRRPVNNSQHVPGL